jgi:hypothetical protein
MRSVKWLIVISLLLVPYLLVAQCNNSEVIDWPWVCYCPDPGGGWQESGYIIIPNSHCYGFEYQWACYEFVENPIKCSEGWGYGPCYMYVAYPYHFACQTDKCDPDILDIIAKYKDDKGIVDLSKYVLKSSDLHSLPADSKTAAFNLFKVTINFMGKLSEVIHVPQQKDSPEYIEESKQLIVNKWAFLRTGEEYKLLVRVLNFPLIK